MASPQNIESASNQAAKIWIGIAVGAAVGIGIALSRSKKTRWDSAREITRRVAERSEDLAEVTRGIVDRVRNITRKAARWSRMPAISGPMAASWSATSLRAEAYSTSTLSTVSKRNEVDAALSRAAAESW